MDILIGLGIYFIFGIITLIISFYLDRYEHKHYTYRDITGTIIVWPVLLCLTLSDYLSELKYKRVRNPFYKENK